ncbi:MAG: thioredoxin domain-containing protein [Microbacteriaceae bacterium]|jgi:protein-disulfide isomerase|nr:thioredoxin domain-containing protein [Microbacteriaceae bacterium]MDR9444215.1 thioredoxin domain-containing protein [Microbacteriaceae bacterium]
MNEKPTRSEQREIARQKAREIREQQQKKEKRNKLIIQLSVVVVLLGTVGVVVAFIFGSQGSDVARPELDEKPANMEYDNGIRLGEGLEPIADAEQQDIPNIQIWMDYQCPVCQAFDVPNSQQIRSWVDTGVATVEYHPISFLDRSSVDNYSSRAANFSACTANYSPESFFDVNGILMERQPGEGTGNLDNDDLLDIAEEAGVNVDEDFTACVESKAFGDWIQETTNEVLTNPRPDSGIQISGTPAVVVNGEEYTWATGDELVNPARFASFVQSTMAE